MEKIRVLRSFSEEVIQTKKCKHCTQSFDITDKDLEFYDKVSPKFNGVKYGIPTPTLCPDCRQQRRLSWRNERKLYKRKCDATGRDIISTYSPNKKIKVYNSDDWWSDKWDALDYGIDFNFEETFFAQFKTLIEVVPFPAMLFTNCENSESTTYTINSRNCFMCSGATNCEDCLYSQFININHGVLDSLMVYNSDNCYYGIDSHNCFNCKFFIKSSDCEKCININECINCKSCIECQGLVDKEYYYKNKYIGKEKYEDIILNYKLEIKILDSNRIVKYANILNSENCTGDGINSSNNGIECFDCIDIQDSKYMYFTPHAVYSQDCTYTASKGVEYCYNVCSTVGVSNSAFTFLYWFGSNSYYSIYCNNCDFCFGCIGLKNKQYCILNKQYTKEEYNKLVPKIIEKMKQDGEWGEFFPSYLSPFGYNETVAQEYFPLEKSCRDVALLHLFNWSDYEPPKPNVEKVIPASKLPEKIENIPDDILNWAIKCEVTDKPYRIIKPELEFYRKHNLPIPRRHPDQRHLDRMKLRNPRKLWDRKCDKCGEEIKTTYGPDREEVVYCEKCYNKEVY